jgi:hypothetical protein
MRQTDEPIVMAGPLFQPIRGLLFAVAFYPLRSVLFGRKNGWLAMWCGILSRGLAADVGTTVRSN